MLVHYASFMIVVAQLPDPAAFDGGVGNSAAKRVSVIEDRLAIEDRISKLELEVLSWPANQAVSDAKRIADLKEKVRLSTAPEAPTWLDAVGKPLGWLLSASFLTFVLGLLKQKHDDKRWKHEKELASLESTNRWRLTYLQQATDATKTLQQRTPVLRLLAEASEDAGLKRWATAEVGRSQEFLELFDGWCEGTKNLALLDEQIPRAQPEERDALEEQASKLRASMREQQRKLRHLDPAINLVDP